MLARAAACALPALLAVLGGCATPAERIDAVAAARGWERRVETGLAHAHVVYRNRAPAPDGVLHVYIENDGTPWLGRYGIAADPTPDRPLMLDLMALDPAAAVYLGRPCYLGQASVAPCTPADWTHGRYATRVVDSMAAALRTLLAAQPAPRLAFFGHSGGGTLAVLLAARFPETVAVVTLAANLDVGAWTRWHGYTPLRDSLDPLHQPALGPDVLQTHYVGADDRNVPPALLRAYRALHPEAIVMLLPGVDHDCCWRGAWPAILRGLATHAAR